MGQNESNKDIAKVYEGPRFSVCSTQVVGSNGQLIQRDFVQHPGAVVILPILDAEHIIMIRNERFAIQKTLWELPAGTLEKGEEPIVTAKRELIEEIGYQAGNMALLTQFYSSPGYSNELLYAYIAKDLVWVGQELDETEKITIEIVTWKQALNMASNGTIVDAKTLAAFLFYHSFC